ncbi:MAG: cytochrome c [Candidatus Udaeobacter sp.]|jgi:mono/diheme cytochrome c family protein
MKTIIILTISILIAAPLAVRAADAKTNWANNCVQCHGPDGKANTKMGKTLSAKDLTDPKVQAEFTDAKATQSIKEGVKQNGKTTMKAFGGKLTDDEIKALVAYVRTLKK